MSLQKYLKGKHIKKEYYKDLSIVFDTVGYNKKVLDWFVMLHKLEIFGWRNKPMAQKIALILQNSAQKGKPIRFYALLCPSYKKGKNIYGFRKDGIGNTTKSGIKNLYKISVLTRNQGFKTSKPLVIF